MDLIDWNAELRVSAVTPQRLDHQGIFRRQPLEDPTYPVRSPRARIVLAEDNDDLRYVMQAVLESEGYMVFACCDGRAALQICGSELAIDLLVTDFEMPYLNGIQLATEVKALRRFLPTMLVSGASLSSEVLAFVRLSGWQFVQKPFAIPDLLRTIQVALSGGAASSNSLEVAAGSAQAA